MAFVSRTKPSLRIVPLVNNFDSADRFDLDEVREALGVGETVPLVECDARDRGSVKDVLLSLIEDVLLARARSAVDGGRLERLADAF